MNHTHHTYQLGARVFATQHSAVCEPGEAGIVVEIYAKGGCSILFEHGGFDGFSPDEQSHFTLSLGSFDAQAASYCFVSVMRLEADRFRGLFDFSAFPPYASSVATGEKTLLEDSCVQIPRQSTPRRI